MSVDPRLMEKSTQNLSEDEIRAELHEHYTDIEMFIEGVARDHYHLVLNGSPGMGKTEFTNDVLKKFNGQNKPEDYPKIPQPRRLSGTASGIKMFVELQKAKEQGQITIVDDTDKILEDSECLDLLKGCLDSQEDKEVSWAKYSTAIKNADVKQSFVYKGRLIIITNKKIQNIQDDNATLARLRLDPVMDRVQYVRAGLPSNEWKMEAIKMFYEGYTPKGEKKPHERYELRCLKGVPKNTQKEIMLFVEKNKDRFSLLSFRTVYKIVSLWEQQPNRWDRMAERSLFSQY